MLLVVLIFAPPLSWSVARTGGATMASLRPETSLDDLSSSPSATSSNQPTHSLNNSLVPYPEPATKAIKVMATATRKNFGGRVVGVG
ncbi:hypothetical protein BDZ97DRAFT_1872653 [Flammula alnicola]|nr:hypothetical protein BDZ97DRAFT_1872653 [Flammula alnicola]